MIISIAGCRTYFDDQRDEGQINRLMDEWMDILDNVSEGPDNPKKAKIALKKKIASCTEIKDAMEKIN